MRVKNKAHKISRIRHLQLTHLGTKKKPELSSKAGEALDVVPFAVSLAHQFSGYGGKYQLLASAGRELVLIQAVLKNNPRRLNADSCQRLMASCVKHLFAYGAAKGVFIPKHHSFIHLCRSARFSGNPSAHSTFTDESENGEIARMGKKTHPFDFPYAVARRQVARERLGL